MNRSMYRYTRAALLYAIAFTAAGCGDPVLEARIRALGGETRGVEQGPTHRPGQPCLLCHSSEGAGEGPEMSVAGTIYQKPDRDIPVEHALVEITDAAGVRRQVRSNCAGNFYITANEWSPLFPLHVQISHAALAEAVPMESKVGREGACAACHALQPGPTAARRVYLVDDPAAADWASPVCEEEEDD